MADNTPTTANHRVAELDFLKFVFIVLMVVFHLAWFSRLHPDAKQFVYTFHMPAFLVMSGYLMNMSKTAPRFFRTIWWLLVPYAVMESGYIAMASVLPIAEHIDGLTLAVFADKLLLHPIGPYWYLHTMALCGTLCYLVIGRLRLSVAGSAIVACFLLYVCSRCGVVSMSCACYFLAGVVIRQVGIRLERLLAPTMLALLPLLYLAADKSCHDKATVAGIAIVWLTMSLAASVMHLLSRAAKSEVGSISKVAGSVLSTALTVGRNTLSIILFSPIFTILCKPLIPVLSFDSTGLLFAVVATTVTIGGCLATTFVLDRMHISPFLLGKDRALSL